MVSMETMQFHISKMDLFLRNIIFSIKMISFNHLTSIRKATRVPLVHVGLLTLMGTSLSNGLPHFLSFINIHEYANEILVI